MRAAADAGFTLIESLVALAVLAVGATTLLAAAEAHVGTIRGLEDRAAARWVAENHLAALRLGLDPEPAARMMGADWTVAAEERPTADPAIAMVLVRVAPVGGPGDGATAALLTGFIDRGALAAEGRP
ncbi:type II secretion system minor pseudopilin GspI [Jannaschia sp. W003]|uniref:type II secretion system minor pseudopilin GspI n=1 Tax=Jannaschia sp. W003 TaxID=2867012 RepID=UPI0021A7244F|nr:type II secretion system minor pseudopilin GspI [Jannaschia sp. W003]UWQ23145.1 type II secretion system minor pseudopilin GspI [Jannaschia sp. W003]